MTLSSIVGILWRQRVFVIPAAVLATLLCGLAVVASPPTYRASGSVVLLSPPALPQTQLGGPSIPSEWQNPYTRIGDLSVVVDILVRVLNSEAVLARLESAGFVGVPEIAANRDYYRGPIVDVAAEAPSADAAIANVNLLISELDRELTGLQSEQGTASEYFIKSSLVISPDRATTVFSGTLRQLMVAIAVGSALVVGTGLVADRLRSSTRYEARRRRGRNATSAVRSGIGEPNSPRESGRLAAASRAETNGERFRPGSETLRPLEVVPNESTVCAGEAMAVYDWGEEQIDRRDSPADGVRGSVAEHAQ